MTEMRNAHKILVGKPEGKRPLGKPRRRWEGNIRMDLRELWQESVNWILPTQGKGQAPLLMLAGSKGPEFSFRGHLRVDRKVVLVSEYLRGYNQKFPY
jgi:hypothetical protein